MGSKKRLVFHALDDMGVHNLNIRQGVIYSPSFLNLLVGYNSSLYANFNNNQEKENVFESIRQEYYPLMPSRLDSLYCFNDYETANKMNIDWWGGSRKIFKVRILSREEIDIPIDTNNFRLNYDEFDLNILDLNISHKEMAHKYFSKKYTDNPVLEVLINGCVKAVDYE
ncbi:DUF2441 domain-containing protein [Cysteiniphilum marinum]|uniref:DUF2441 domain-containing protein n=1 Tax=Cysteiniphilum marinum TaxID=2774191 RepID=UPI001939D6FA|nr:DUF2441 domain-containing protein [Cysteiniphilum marinum]